MKKLALLILLVIGCIVFSNFLLAQGIPQGSYQLTCIDISVNGDVLSATCETLNGENQETSMSNLFDCLNAINSNGDIGNIDGNLICIPDLVKVDPMFNFPESELVLDQWIYEGNSTEIYQHSWGIWTGLTQLVGNVNQEPVRAFETWSTINDMLFLMELSTEESPGRLDLSPPRQFRNKNSDTMDDSDSDSDTMDDSDSSSDTTEESNTETSSPDTNIFVSVAYNPPAANHAILNKLFLKSTLDQLLKDGYTEIPNFPNNSITIKPVYKVIPQNVANGIYVFPGWPGTPVPAKTFGEGDWDSCVYVNINETGEGGSSIDQGCQGITPDNTFYLNNFIHNKVTSADANYLSKQLNVTVSEGDYVILVGMHVTTREMKRWAWQTFWWSANPNDPYLPSSKEIADIRPDDYLDSAAQHYAMSVVYQMVNPAQPIIGGESVGEPVIGYNPYLEAGFDPSTFQISKPINNNGKIIVNEYGVQTNCMTCHGLAAYNPQWDYSSNGNREKPYAADFYLDLDDSHFNGQLKLDFAWSILGALDLNK